MENAISLWTSASPTPCCFGPGRPSRAQCLTRVLDLRTARRARSVDRLSAQSASRCSSGRGRGPSLLSQGETSRGCCACRGSLEDEGETSPGSTTESLFARELRKRGLSRPPQPPEDPVSATPQDDVTKGRNSSGGASWAEGQRERSTALNSEGLEGLPIRASSLVQLGLSFWLFSWPFVLLAVGATAACYLIWGTNFVHGGRPPEQAAVPSYIDPYELLRQEEDLLPMVPFRTNVTLAE